MSDPDAYMRRIYDSTPNVLEFSLATRPCMRLIRPRPPSGWRSDNYQWKCPSGERTRQEAIGLGRVGSGPFTLQPSSCCDWVWLLIHDRTESKHPDTRAPVCNYNTGSQDIERAFSRYVMQCRSHSQFACKIACINRIQSDRCLLACMKVALAISES